jgi:hypothetical protein
MRMWVLSLRRAAALERNQSNSALAQSIEGLLFDEKPLGGIAFGGHLI